jgi:hypothetical protein
VFWQRTDGAVSGVSELGFLTVRAGVNSLDALSAPPSALARAAHPPDIHVLHDHGRMCVVATPLTAARYPGDPGGLRSIQTAVVLATPHDDPAWEVFINGRPVRRFPAEADFNDCITVEDGVMFAGIRSVEGPDLGRDVKVRITRHHEPGAASARGRTYLLIENFNLSRREDAQPVPAPDTSRWPSIYGGFFVELGDNTEFEDFRDFDRQFRRGRMRRELSESGSVLRLEYASAAVTMNAELRASPGLPLQLSGKIESRRSHRDERTRRATPTQDTVRESSVSHVSRSGTMARNGAVLNVTPGRTAALVSEPRTGTVMAVLPFPDPAEFALSLPNGWQIEADGPLMLATIEAQPSANALTIHTPGTNNPGLATALLLFGAFEQPLVELNGMPLDHEFPVIETDNGNAVVMPLDGVADRPRLEEAAMRYLSRRHARDILLASDVRPRRPVLWCERDGKHTIGMPGQDTWTFQRWTQSGSYFLWRTARGDVLLAADGRLALRALHIDLPANVIRVEAPEYAQFAAAPPTRFDDKAEFLLVSGTPDVPAVYLNGKLIRETATPFTSGDGDGWAIPLFGRISTPTPETHATAFRRSVARAAPSNAPL